jgi:tetratricopeptide (TPR) repeat protein
VGPGGRQLAADPLARLVTGPLTGVESSVLASKTLPMLHAAWHDAPSGAQARQMWQLTGLWDDVPLDLLDDIAAIRAEHMRDEVDIAQAMAGVLSPTWRKLESARQRPSFRLCCVAFACAEFLGEKSMLESAAEWISEGLLDQPDLDAAGALIQRGAWLFDLGRIDEAARDFQQAAGLAERAGAALEQARARGWMAEVLVVRGQLDDALRLQREELLPTYEQLGDERGRVLTMRAIARILDALGQYDEGLRIRREEELPAWERLGSSHDRAITQYEIGVTLKGQHLYDEALPALYEASSIFERLGDLRSKAQSLTTIAEALHWSGNYSEAARVRSEELVPMLERLTAGLSVVAPLMAIALDLHYSDVSRSARIYAELVPVLRGAGDLHLAGMLTLSLVEERMEEGEFDEAMRLLREQRSSLQGSGDRVLRRSTELAIARVVGAIAGKSPLQESVRIRRDEQIPLLRAIREADLNAGVRHPEDVALRSALVALANELQALGRDDEALEMLLEQLPLNHDCGGYWETAKRIAPMLADRGRRREALKLVRETPVPEGEGDGVTEIIAFMRSEIDEMTARLESSGDEAPA